MPITTVTLNVDEVRLNELRDLVGEAALTDAVGTAIAEHVEKLQRPREAEQEIAELAEHWTATHRP